AEAAQRPRQVVVPVDERGAGEQACRVDRRRVHRRSLPGHGRPRRARLGRWTATARKGEDVAQQAVGSLARQVEEAVAAALGRVRPELAGADPLVRRSDRADFQSNVALASAKRVKARPAELASELAEALQGVDGIADVEVSGPGFLNITVGVAGLWRQAGRRAADD